MVARTISASTATVGWPGVPLASIRIRWLPGLFQTRLNSTRVGRKFVVHRLTVWTSSPSMNTLAEPRVGPVGPIQETAAPRNLRPTLAPAWSVARTWPFR